MVNLKIKHLKSIIYILLISNFIFANTYYVDNSVSNGNGTLNSPWNDVNFAVSQLFPGDTLYILSDPTVVRVYSGGISLVRDGSSTNKMYIKAYYPKMVEFQSSSRLIDFDQSGYVFDGIIFNHLNASSDAITFSGGDFNELLNCVIKNGKRDGIDMGNGDHNIIRNCEIYKFDNGPGNDAHGIVLTNGVGNKFLNNKIYDCSGDCIQIIHGNSRSTVIQGNELFTTLNEGSENAIDIKTAYGIRIVENVMYGFRDSPGSKGDAVVFHHDSDSILFMWNEIYDCNGGLRVGESDQGRPTDIFVIENLFHNMIDQGNNSGDGYGISPDGCDNMLIKNNTFVKIAGPLFWLTSNNNNTVIINNIFESRGMLGSINNLTNYTISNNAWYGSNRLSGTNDVEIVDFNSVFVDYNSNNFYLKDNSNNPCKGTGLDGLDIGRYQINEDFFPMVPENLHIMR